MRKIFVFVIVIVFVVVHIFSCAKKEIETSNVDQECEWAFCETDTTGKQADVFFVCPTVYNGSSEQPRMSLEDSISKAKFIGATNMERGIYDDNCRFFAPYYQQAGLNVYSQSTEYCDSVVGVSYNEVRDAFRIYLKKYNNGRPIVLAGFSQGADHCIRLLKEFGNNKEIADKIVSCYAIGWRLTKEEVKECPWLKPATSETDLGSIVLFSSESPKLKKSLIIPEGIWTYSINPLTWVTSSEIANKDQNLGACFTNYSAEIVTEIPNLTGAYIDAERGALKVTDVTEEQYPSYLPGFAEGEYHIYDYQFFYRNLEHNVQKRIVRFLNKK